MCRAPVHVHSAGSRRLGAWRVKRSRVNAQRSIEVTDQVTEDQVHQFVRRKLNMKLKSALADREHQSVLLSWVVADSAGWRVRTRRACVDSELTFS